MWVVLVVVKRRTQQPTHPPINTHRPVPTRPPWKVCSLTRIAEGANQPTHQPTHLVTPHSPTNNPYPSTHTHPATIQDFCTGKGILWLMLEHRKMKEPPTQQLNAVKSLTTSRRLSRSSFPLLGLVRNSEWAGCPTS